MKSGISINNIGGYHPDPTLSKWPAGSIFEVEGQRLYDLVVELKPSVVVELGGFYGCSTMWIAKALRDNKKGKLYSIDNHINGGSWQLLPKTLQTKVKTITADVFKDEIDIKNVDIFFDDGPHLKGTYKRVYDKFKPKMAYVVHDYMHRTVGRVVRPEFDAIVGKPDEVFFEPPTDCGLAIKYFIKKDISSKN